MPVKDPRKSNETNIVISPNITRKESETSIKYIANRGGYVNFEKGSYDIQEQMEINEISFRSTGSIDTNLDSNIKINIKEKDIFKRCHWCRNERRNIGSSCARQHRQWC